MLSRNRISGLLGPRAIVWVTIIALVASGGVAFGVLANKVCNLEAGPIVEARDQALGVIVEGRDQALSDINAAARELLEFGRRVHLQSGVIRINQDGSHPELGNTGACPEEPEGFRGPKNERVEFDPPFIDTLNVVLSLIYLDHIQGANLRFRGEVKQVDARGFNYDLGTWCKANIHEVRVSWVAYL